MLFSIVDVADLEVMDSYEENNSFVEYVCEDELNNMRLALARKIGVPEPVLYDDGLPTFPRENEEDWERLLSDVVDIQERMATGMKMIQECNKILSSARSGRRLPYDTYMAWVERKKNLWEHWNYLKDCCNEQIGEDKWLWRQYFSLCESAPDSTGYTGDDIECPQWVEDIDTQKVWFSDSVDDYQE